MHPHDASTVSRGRKRLIFFSFLVSLQFLLLLVSCTLAYWPGHLRLVDEHAGNLLFRGSEPKTLFGSFAYEELMLSMEAEAAIHKVAFPKKDQRYLVDVNLLTHEAKDIAMEQRYFHNHPDLGEFYHFATYGVNASTLVPACVAAGGSEAMCKNNSALQPKNYPEAIVKGIAQQYATSLEAMR